MRPVLKLPSVRITLGASALIGALLCLSPLLGTPGVESALVLGLVLPLFCGPMGARIALLGRGQPWDGLDLAWNTLSVALAAVGIASLLLAANMLRFTVCSPLEGLAFLVLGPCFAAALAALTGATLGALVPRPRAATTLALGVPLAGIALGVARFWSTPAIFSYAHTVGYFPGTLYDPDIRITGTYLSFRALSLLWMVGAGLLIIGLWNASEGRLRWRKDRWRWVALSVLAFAGAITGEWFGPELGHRSTATSIEEALGSRIEAERCVAVVPREMPRSEARRLAEDCSYRVIQAERTLGVRQPVPVTAFFFRSAEEKRALMGASNTYIAKPWRNEVYLQVSGWPHPVLFHEVVHVVAGQLAPGPFSVAGGLGGWLPSPGVIEGSAVAIAWDGRNGLTPHQWAAAMLAEDLAPPLDSLEGLGFLLQPAGRAYTASGSFLRWILDTQGSAALRRIYRAGSMSAGLDRPLPALEEEWRRFLREEVPLGPEARALARLRFERPGIFGQICPHKIAHLRATLGGDLSAGDDAAAEGHCREILALDPGQAGSRALLAGTLARRGLFEDADQEIARLVGPPAAATPWIQSARLEVADAHWSRGDASRAGQIFRQLAEQPMSRTQRRQIEVRQLALTLPSSAELALRGLLVPPRDRTQDGAVALSHIAALRSAGEPALAAYLEARQLLTRQRFELALPLILSARRDGLPTELIRREARRMEVMIRYGTGDHQGTADLARAIARDPDSSEAERVEAEDWLTRVRLTSG